MSTGAWATAVETHSGAVFFVGDRAYKLKKPVDLGFLDFSSRDARLAACQREVELNRRLVDDVYLGIADVVGPNGRVCDHLVVMRRLPDAARLTALLATANRDILRDAIASIARTLAAFHARQPPVPHPERYGGVDALRALWSSGLDQLIQLGARHVAPELVTETRGLAFRYLDGRQELFDERLAAGAIRDGHGDLLADDIFVLPDGPRLLDCLEFDDRLRIADVLLDAAFLAMDLERLGDPGLAREFLARYVEYAGEHHPQSLAHFYIAYRAHIRAKVTAIRAEQRKMPDPETERLSVLALEHLRAADVVLVLLGGLPGTGKTTTARALAVEMDAVVLSSDVVRKELTGTPLTANASAAYGEGIYTPAITQRVYDELLGRSRILLERGVSVVLDASWHDRTMRTQAHRLADSAAARLSELLVEAPAPVALSRLHRPRRVSDATEEVHRRMAAEFDPWPEATHIDGSGHRAATRAAARQALARST